MPWGVAAAAVGAVGGMYAANKSADAQSSALKQQSKQQKKGMEQFAPYAQSGGFANDRLNALMGFGGGEGETYESLYKSMLPNFVRYVSLPKEGGGLSGALGAIKKTGIGAPLGAQKEGYEGRASTKTGMYGGVLNKKGYLESNPLLAEALASVQGKSGSKTSLDEKDLARLDAAVKAKLAQNERVRGTEGYGSMMKNYTGADLENEPGYQWRLNQGEQSIQRGQAARGGLFSGAAGKELLRYGQGFGSNEYGLANDRYNQNRMNAYNMLSGVKASGQSAAGGMANQFNALGDSYASAGANKAAGYMGQANALSQGLGGAANYWQQQQAMK